MTARPQIPTYDTLDHDNDDDDNSSDESTVDLDLDQMTLNVEGPQLDANIWNLEFSNISAIRLYEICVEENHFSPDCAKPRIWIIPYVNDSGDHRLQIKFTHRVDGTWQKTRLFRVIDDDGSGLAGPWQSRTRSNSVQLKALAAVTAYNESYTRYRDPIREMRCFIERHIRFTHSSRLFPSEWIRQYVQQSNDSIFMTYDEADRPLHYYARIPPNTLSNSSNETISVNLEGFLGYHFHSAATMFQGASDLSDDYMLPAEQWNLAPHARARHWAIMCNCLKKMRARSLSTLTEADTWWSNFTDPEGNHDHDNFSVPFLQLAKAYIDGTTSMDPIARKCKRFECQQIALGVRVMEEFYFGRRDVAKRMWDDEVMKPHRSQIETMSMLTAVHSEKQLKDAFCEIGKGGLIGTSNYSQ